MKEEEKNEEAIFAVEKKKERRDNLPKKRELKGEVSTLMNV